MSTPEAKTAPARLYFPWNLLLFLVTAAYAAVYLQWYSATPLGLKPVLDGNEALLFARRIANGELGPDPFFTPPLYPALLSLALQAGLDDSLLPDLARAVNLSCHLISTLCVAYLARRVWRSRRCGFIAGLLWGLNPVALHFAGDPLPENLAICLLLVGTCGAAQMSRRVSHHLGGMFVCASSWSLAAITVPQGMALMFLAPILALVTGRGAGNKLAASLLAVTIAMATLIGLGYTNYKISGAFRILPLQNTFEFWDANRPGSHGRYPQRLVAAQSFDEPVQSARIESERLYAEQKPDYPTTNYMDIDRYWRQKIWEHIRNSSTQFANHLSNKILYLFNNYEQYDNKTYSLHKQRSPWLAFNPLCWGVLLVLAGAGVALAWRRRLTRVTVAVIAVYAISVVAFFVSARARIPLAPLLAVFSGWIGRPRYQFGRLKKRPLIIAGVTALVLGILTFAPLPENERLETVIFDHIIMARSAMELGDHLLAVRHSEAAVDKQPHSALALETLCLTRYRYWLHKLPEQAPVSVVRASLDACQNAVRLLESQHAALASANYLWYLGDREEALHIWYELADSSSEHTEPALQALIVTGQTRSKDDAWLNMLAHEDMSTPLLAALTLANNQSARTELAKRLTDAELKSQLDALRAQFQLALIPSAQ